MYDNLSGLDCKYQLFFLNSSPYLKERSNLLFNTVFGALGCMLFSLLFVHVALVSAIW